MKKAKLKLSVSDVSQKISDTQLFCKTNNVTLYSNNDISLGEEIGRGGFSTCHKAELKKGFKQIIVIEVLHVCK